NAARAPRRSVSGHASARRLPGPRREDVGRVRLLQRDRGAYRRAGACRRADARRARRRLAELPLALASGLRRGSATTELHRAPERFRDRRSLGPARMAVGLPARARPLTMRLAGARRRSVRCGAARSSESQSMKRLAAPRRACERPLDSSAHVAQTLEKLRRIEHVELDIARGEPRRQRTQGIRAGLELTAVAVDRS